jgi:hypothetical protein
MKKLIFIAALGLGISSPAWSAGTSSLTANLVDAKTMDAIFAKSTQETQLARRGGGRGWGGRGHHGYRGYGHRGGYYRGGNWVGPAVGGALIGAIIANQAYSAPRYREEVVYREVPVYRDAGRNDAAKRRCAAKYRSYDWRSETYVTYGGEVRSCP